MNSRIVQPAPSFQPPDTCTEHAECQAEYLPDYKSKEPRLPKDWGTVKALCANGQHRYMPNAPKCGCGETFNAGVERSDLEREVIEKAKTFIGDETATTYSAFKSATNALIEFESQQIKK